MFLKTNWQQQIDIQLTGQYSPSTLGEFELGQAFGLNGIKKVLGLRIPDENELNASANPQGGARLINYTQLKCFCISLWNPDANEMSITNLPLTALVINGANEIKSGPFYEINQRVDWTKCMLNVCSIPAALAAGTFYNLTIAVIFEL